MPVIATGEGSAEAAQWQLRHGASQLLCVPPQGPLPRQILIHALDAESRRATLAVAASLLRHVAAEAVYLGIHPATALEGERAACTRDLLDARSVALNEHGLDMRTELRSGEAMPELLRELAATEQGMLVIGTSDPGRLPRDWLAAILEGTPARPVLVVNASRVDAAAEAA
jgi:hypothetical protein